LVTAAISIYPTSGHCEGAPVATEAIPNPSGRWLRFSRHDRCRQGDGFAEFTLSEANVPAMTGTAGRHCEGAPVATEAIPNPAGRWLRFARHDSCRQGNGYEEFTLSEANVPAMTGTARCHCEGAPVATEAISSSAGRWLCCTDHA